MIQCIIIEQLHIVMLLAVFQACNSFLVQKGNGPNGSAHSTSSRWQIQAKAFCESVSLRRCTICAVPHV
jgi:hypothetical protein